jgi:hypothetical protein
MSQAGATLQHPLITKNDADKTGMVRVYDIPAQEWAMKFAPDAREGLARGTMSKSGPVYGMSKGSEKCSACEVEVGQLQAKGWKVDSQPEAPKNAKQGAIDFNNYTVPELRAFAMQAIANGGLKDFAPQHARKADLVSVLDDIDFKPGKQSDAAPAAPAPVEDVDDDDEDEDGDSDGGSDGDSDNDDDDDEE